MAPTRVETFRAYRDVLLRRFEGNATEALEPVPGGEWDGLEVVRRKELEQILADLRADEPEPLSHVGEVRTPATVYVDAVCPRCSIPARLLVSISTELVVSDDGAEIRAKAKSKPSAHTCGQLPLDPDAPADDDEQLRLADLVGPTEPTLVLAHDVPRPEDATLDLAADEKCGAEVEVPTGEDGLDEILFCERPIDHAEADGLGEPREHWAEGGFGWHYEERPIPAEPQPIGDQDEEE